MNSESRHLFDRPAAAETFQFREHLTNVLGHPDTITLPAWGRWVEIASTAVAAALLLGATLVACIPPTWRAMHVDPIEGLRVE